MRFCKWKMLPACLGLAALTYICPDWSSARIKYSDATLGPMVLVFLTAEEVPKYLDYKGSRLAPVVRIKVAYREVDKNKNNIEVKYEDIWYANGKPVGLVRYHHLDPEQSQIMLRVNQAHLEESELEPMANAMTRVYLDICLNNNSIYNSTVPEDSFSGMIDAFRSQRFFSSGEFDTARVLDSSISLPLSSTHSGQNRVLFFAVQ